VISGLSFLASNAAHVYYANVSRSL